MDQERAFPWLAVMLVGVGLGAAVNGCSSSESGGSGGSGIGGSNATGAASTTGGGSSATGMGSGGAAGTGSGGAGTTTATGAGGAGTTTATGAGGAGTTTATGSGGAGTTTATSTGAGTGGGGPVECDEPGGTVPPLELTEVARGLDRPLYVTSEPDAANRLYVVEQNGRIRLIVDGTLRTTPFLDISPIVAQWAYSGDEKGLLGLVFHPDYASNGRFFVYFNENDRASGRRSGGLRLSEFRRSASDPDRAGSVPVRDFFIVSDGVQTNHNGGMLAFGPDGMLYIGVGDGGGASDPNRHGQNIAVKLAKILRIDVDAYPTAPAGNLPGGDPQIWDYGLRNPWRFSFDRCRGDLYIGDVGQSRREEIHIEPRGLGNRNYGWSIMEGTVCIDPGEAPGCTGSFTPPVKEYGHGSGDGSVTGGYVYRGSNIPALRGVYLYGDFVSNRIWTLTWRRGSVVSESELTRDLQSADLLQGLASFGEDAAGELYVVDYAPAPNPGTAGSGGRIFRIDPE
jgi:glucose/arabinose dehydrogenase